MKSKTAKVCSQAIDQYRIPPFFEPEWLFCYSNRSFIKPNPGFVDKRAGLAVYATHDPHFHWRVINLSRHDR